MSRLAHTYQPSMDQIEAQDRPNEIHQRCFHCGAYADECVCDGGWGLAPAASRPCPRCGSCGCGRAGGMS